MSDIPRPWRSTLFGILTHPVEPRILMHHSSDSKWNLPCVEVEEFIWMPDIGSLMPHMEAQFGQRAAALHCLNYVIQREPDCQITLVYAFESLGRGSQSLENAEWIGRDELAMLTLADPSQRNFIEAVIDEHEGSDLSALRPVWSRRGWFAEAEAWIEGELARLEYRQVAPVALVRTWGISCVLRANTDHGAIYFKVASSLALFGHEPMLMQALAAEHPDYIPAPLAIDIERRWMLLPDVGSSLRNCADMAIFESTLRALSEIQVDYVHRTDDLFAFGCLDRRLERLVTQIDPLFADSEILAALTDDERADLRSLASRLKQMCSELTDQPVPQTLIHGDLNVGNVAANNGQIRFFDWTDGAVSHPFFDVVTLLDEMVPALKDSVQDAKAHLVNVYLSAWSKFGSAEQLAKVWKLAEPLGSLHQAVSYQYIAHTLEGTSKGEIGAGCAYWLRQLLKALDTENKTKTR